MIRGSCLCGDVAFEIAAPLTPILYCHAARCRKATGGPFSPEMLTTREGFRWVRGEALVATYEAPLLVEPPVYRRSFCRLCGSPLPVAIDGTPFVAVIAGALDDDPGTRPFRHGFVGQRACWHEITDGLPQSQGRPEEPPPGWSAPAPDAT